MLPGANLAGSWPAGARTWQVRRQVRQVREPENPIPRQHHLASKAKFPTSTFYREFPSLECERASTYGAKTGVFESLQMRMAIGFESTSEVANMLDKDVSEGGISRKRTRKESEVLCLIWSQTWPDSRQCSLTCASQCMGSR